MTIPTSIKSCFDLRKDLQGNQNILLVDCRSRSDYLDSHLKSENVVLHIPEDKLQMGMTAWKVGAVFDNDRDRALWTSRAMREAIILMDWSTRGPEDAIRGTSLWILKDIMLNVSRSFNFDSFNLIKPETLPFSGTQTFNTRAS